MAKTIAGAGRRSKTNLNDLPQKDIDILTLDTKVVMDKYKIGKQNVYDRKFALYKKIKSTGLTVEQVVNPKIAQPAPQKEPLKKVQAKKTAAKKTAAKKTAAKKTRTKKAQLNVEPEKIESPVKENLSASREIMVVDKQVPVIMKPIEINFENFSIRLNGVPKKISVNPDTNAIEIDL